MISSAVEDRFLLFSFLRIRGILGDLIACEGDVPVPVGLAGTVVFCMPLA